VKKGFKTASLAPFPDFCLTLRNEKVFSAIRMAIARFAIHGQYGLYAIMEFNFDDKT
jgi:hypothetical protein